MLACIVCHLACFVRRDFSHVVKREWETRLVKIGSIRDLTSHRHARWKINRICDLYSQYSCTERPTTTVIDCRLCIARKRNLMGVDFSPHKFAEVRIKN